MRVGKKDPSTIIIGALGRCGFGAQELLSDLSLTSTNWDVEETKPGGPFKELIQHNIFINTVLMNFKIPPFLTPELMKNNTQLKFICDVSCDPNSELNPIPIYEDHTSWDAPLLKVESSKIEANHRVLHSLSF